LSPSHRRREHLLAYLLLTPALGGFAVFVFYPLAKTAWLGLYETPPFPNLPSRFVGLSQYASVLTSSSFLSSTWTTVLFVVFTVPAGLALGLGLAVLAHRRLRGSGLFRTIYSSTIATSTAVASVIFFTLLDPEVGLFSYWLGQRGGTGVLGNPTLALPEVAVVTIWQNLGFTFILLSAALLSIPEDLLEAASIDGSSPSYRFWHVSFPLLTPTLFLAGVVGMISSFQAFGQIDILTAGGPDNHTLVLMYNIYQSAFVNNNDGQAAVIAIALFSILAVLTFIQFAVLERRVHYGR
jgi:sn-glycerol 3-phosphate transport system permease protein